MLELAHSHFEESTTRFPSSWTTYKNWGISLKTFALHEAIVSPVTKYLILFMSLGKLTRAYEVRMRSFKEEDVFLNYEIIFVCIQLILNEKMLRIKLPSFKIADYLLEAKKYSPFFSKLSCDHAIYHTLSEDISKYGLFFASCFINIYLPHDPYLVKLKNLQFLSQSPSEDSHENIIRRSTSKTSEGFDMFSLTLSQSLVPIDLYNIKSLYIPICPYLSITHDLIHGMLHF